MKLFVNKTVTFFIILFLLFIIGIVIPPTPKIANSLLFGKTKKDSLLVNTPYPRLILVGGSNLSFGINSEIIKDSLKVNPVNTAIHANIGLRFMLEHTISFVKKGDVIVVVPEYDQYYGDYFYGGENLVRTVFDVSKKDYDVLSLKQWIHVFPQIMKYSMSKYNLKNLNFKKLPTYSSLDSIYLKSSFNNFGDASVHWHMKGIYTPPAAKLEDESNKFNQDVIEELNKFQTEALQKGAKVYISFPSYQESSFNNNQSAIYNVQKALNTAGFKVLGTPTRYRFADSLCFNTPYHLVKKAVDIRTKLLIQDLRDNLN
ncbi:MAG: hypothetical protein AAGC65_14695 [Mucilaginibacter sp.]|uniref:hypothetical protein n=1 Tax=Mucilaginibacter sp. TaxID=1882438 RepID=UPI0031AB3553